MQLKFDANACEGIARASKITSQKSASAVTQINGSRVLVELTNRDIAPTLLSASGHKLALQVASPWSVHLREADIAALREGQQRRQQRASLSVVS